MKREGIQYQSHYQGGRLEPSPKGETEKCSGIQATQGVGYVSPGPVTNWLRAAWVGCQFPGTSGLLFVGAGWPSQLKRKPQEKVAGTSDWELPVGTEWLRLRDAGGALMGLATSLIGL